MAEAPPRPVQFRAAAFEDNMVACSVTGRGRGLTLMRTPLVNRQ
jgi:hypothetical protein